MCKSNDNYESKLRLRPAQETLWDTIREFGFSVTPLHDADSVAYIGYGHLGNLCAMDTSGQIIPVGNFFRNYSVLYHDMCRTLAWLYMQYQQNQSVIENQSVLEVVEDTESAYDAWEMVTEYLYARVSMGVEAAMLLLSVLDDLTSITKSSGATASIPQKKGTLPKLLHGFLSMSCLPIEKGAPFPKCSLSPHERNLSE